MRTTRLITKNDIEDYVDIFANAYPGIDLFSSEKRKSSAERLLSLSEHPACHIYALFEDGHMRGHMRLYDFQMTLLSIPTLAGGIGAVAVDLLHKKEKVAADMLHFFLKHYQEKGACMTILYPFNPDFYRRMGFGYGTPMHTYTIKPASLPQGPSKAHLQVLGRENREAIVRCRDLFVAGHNGLLARLDFFWDRHFNDPAVHIVGVKRGEQLSGYLIYKFLKNSQENFLDNDLLVRELVYDSAADLQELLTFLHIQKDQVNRIIINSQDEALFFLFSDPRNGSGKMLRDILYHECSTGGLGIMYRVVDVPRLFRVLGDHDFNGVTCRLKIILADSFFPQNAGETIVHFQNGRATVAPGAGYDLEVAMDVGDFSSLVTGAINFAKLHEFGLATISDAAFVPVLDRLFAAPKPICYTSF